MATPSQLPDFDPYELLGVDASADDTTVDRAYKARIRYVHPDIAGTAGLNETKRLNIAREWLLDPELRERLPKPTLKRRRKKQERAEETPSWRPEPPPPPPPPTQASEDRSWWDGGPPRREPPQPGPSAFDFGPANPRLHSFFDSIRALSDDERARVTYSLGDEPPLFFDEFEDLLGERIWARSEALDDAIADVWGERRDEAPPLHFPRGRVFGNGAVVVNAYAQWILLEDAIRQRTRDADVVAALASRCTWAWDASVGRDRYGPQQAEVVRFLEQAEALSDTEAERLARAWQRDFGSYLYGRPGEDWFPGTHEQPDDMLVSARLAAVDASRIEPPEELGYEQHNGFRCGLRLAAHVVGLGGADQDRKGYLRPWQEALDPSPSFRDRARWGMPLG